MHVEVIADRIERRFGVAMDLAPPHVPYRETVTKPAEAEGKHKKQSGGRGQYADCWLRVEPLERGAGFEFVDKIVGGAIPRSFIPAVEKGVLEAMQQGELAGYPVVDVRVTLYDGKYHPVDSSEMAFKIAGGLGMKAAIAKAGPVLLEPVMHVEITVPVGARRRRDGRPQLPPRPPARHGGAGPRRDRAGRGPDGRDARVRARPARHDRRAGRLRACSSTTTPRCRRTWPRRRPPPRRPESGGSPPRPRRLPRAHGAPAG